MGSAAQASKYIGMGWLLKEPKMHGTSQRDSGLPKLRKFTENKAVKWEMGGYHKHWERSQG